MILSVLNKHLKQLCKFMLILLKKIKHDFCSKQPTYKKFLTEQLNTDFHQNLLLDFFWWYFLEKFGVSFNFKSLYSLFIKTVFVSKVNFQKFLMCQTYLKTNYK